MTGRQSSDMQQNTIPLYCVIKIFGVSDNESMLHMKRCLGLPSLMNMIEIDAVNLWIGYQVMEALLLCVMCVMFLGFNF